MIRRFDIQLLVFRFDRYDTLSRFRKLSDDILNVAENRIHEPVIDRVRIHGMKAIITESNKYIVPHT